MPLRFLRTLKLDDLEKRPMAVIIALLIISNIYFITKNDTRESEAKKEAKDWQNKAWDLSIKLLEKNKIIDEKEKEVEVLKSAVTDSATRGEVERPLKNILR